MSAQADEVIQEGIRRWDLDALRSVRYETTQTVLFARHSGMLQRMYAFGDEQAGELQIRCVKGIPCSTPMDGMVWLQAYSESSSAISIGVDSAYIYERTGSLITPQMLAWGGDGVVPLLAIAIAALNEFENFLSIQITSFLPEQEQPKQQVRNYLALDENRDTKVLVLGNALTLKALEEHVSRYCSSYLEDYDQLAGKIRFEMLIGIEPSKKIWRSEELGELAPGDLLAVQNYDYGSPVKGLRGYLRFRGNRYSRAQYEVFIMMSEEGTKLEFGSEELDQVDDGMDESLIPPHENIELEIHAGKTKILFNDLCSVQAGTLIELRDHALPLVTLCVMGSPILEGELVHFQDQLMVQVTRRID